MQMRCCACACALLIMYIGLLLLNNKLLMVNGEALSDKRSLINSIQLGIHPRRNVDNYPMYRNENMYDTWATNNISEIILHHNRNPKSIKSHRRKKRRNKTTKKSKCKSKCVTERPKRKLKPAAISAANISDKKEDLVERASLNWPTKAMHAAGKRIENLMTGSSQIGDRKYITLVKPTVVVNYHGAVKYEKNKGKLGKGRDTKRGVETAGENVININQEVNLGPPRGAIRVEASGTKNKTKQDIKKHINFRHI